MNDIELKKGRKKYNYLLKSKECFIKEKAFFEKLIEDSNVKKYILLTNLKNKDDNTNDTINELKKNESVIKYIDLLRYIKLYNQRENSNENIVNKALSNLAKNTKDSKNIFIYMGSYDINDNLTIEEQNTKYNLYMDLETIDEYKISKEEYLKFENNNIVYKFSNDSIVSNSDYMDKFFKLRNNYLNSLIIYSQEEAIDMLISDSKNLIKGK